MKLFKTEHALFLNKRGLIKYLVMFLSNQREKMKIERCLKYTYIYIYIQEWCEWVRVYIYVYANDDDDNKERYMMEEDRKRTLEVGKYCFC